MKSKSTIFYAIAIILLTLLVIVSGYYSKGDWLKGQLGQDMPSLSSAEGVPNGTAAT